ncbi:unnamed protein product [Plasmodium vivax]|uniref:RAD protein (Pv-fam-e) n=2 Tax=Plasmodium vivax TaxID=5855 RepID=A5K605_PLAVS|nr:RAD protein (Pv-fam-e) [Plasmodium vivax]EDL45340.1 RAD protein (Pv-fam-e) [Plasmodium vivax]CAG9479922.1 unnamed protein product [Plasmodium vivax]CAI7718933.1 Plasmodium exported protein (PHIST), unknown function [Plasmodium vivax]|eukprot:XP_001615067.1 RAD protein (Pv-fam-e) [Plasmodium vivax Sal-1]
MKMLSAPRAVFCLFTLLNIVVLNNVTPSSDQALSSPDVRAFPRHLSEMMNDSYNNDLSENKRTRQLYNDFLADNLFPKHADNAALLSSLSRKEYLIREKPNYGQVSNREMVNLLDGYNKLYVLEHARMMKRLSNTLNGLSKKYKIPEKETRKLWNECKRSIESKLNRKMDSHKPRYNSLVMSCSASVADFGDFYKYYVTSWNKALKKSEKKWNKIFIERAKNYRSGAK